MAVPTLIVTLHPEGIIYCEYGGLPALAKPTCVGLCLSTMLAHTGAFEGKLRRKHTRYYLAVVQLDETTVSLSTFSATLFHFCS